MTGRILLGLLLICVVADQEAFARRQPFPPSCPDTDGPFVCFMIYRPVCGTDGITYSNECTLCYHIQKTKRHIQIAFTGECPQRQPLGK
ncbi:putative pancreatic secretory proteinase inhibitor [Vanacampus margaritifer]